MTMRSLAVGLALLLFPATGPSLAQEAPRRLLPAERNAAPAPVAEPAPPSPSPGGPIRAKPLAAPPLAALGIGPAILPGEGAVWRDVKPESVLALLDILPDRLSLPSLRQLGIRLLAAPGPEIGGDTGRSILLRRLRGLRRLGALDLALELAALPAIARDPGIRAEARLTAAEAGRIDPVCAMRPADDVLSERERSALGIACALIRNRELARLRLQLAEERGIRLPSYLRHVFEQALAGEPLTVRLPVGEERLPLLLLYARLPLAEFDLEGELGSDPALLSLFADHPNLAPGLRLAAAEKAAVLGWRAPARLRADYLRFAAHAATAAGGDRAGDSALVRRATMVARLAAEKVPAARAALLRQAEDLQGAGPERLVWLNVLATDAASLDPDPSLDWAAPLVIPPLLAADDVEAARAWYGLWRQRARKGKDAAANRRMAVWMALRQGTPVSLGFGEWAPRQRLLLLALAAGTGLETREEDWIASLSGLASDPPPPVPALPLWWITGKAAREGRIGEAALAAVDLLGSSPETAAPLALERVLGTLRRLGRPGVARRLAIEIALALRL